MKKVYFYLSLTLLLSSCAKEAGCPQEFDHIIGEWDAYQYERIDYQDGLPALTINYSTDSVGMEYFFQVTSKKIEIYHSHTKSIVSHISKIDIVLETNELVNFNVLTYTYPDFEKKEYTVVYNKNSDELQVESCVLNSPNGSVDYCDIFKLKREI